MCAWWFVPVVGLTCRLLTQWGIEWVSALPTALLGDLRLVRSSLRNCV